MRADVRKYLIRELLGLVVVVAILTGLQTAVDDVAPIWALALFVCGWVVFRALEIRGRHRRQATPAE